MTLEKTSLAAPALRPLRAESAGTIRPYEAADAREVANLLVRAFQRSNKPAPQGMVAYLNEVYLEAPWYDPTIASRVMTTADGRITGFIGVSAFPVRIGDRRVRAAITSSLAVDPHGADPMTGPRLLRDVRSGNQDAVLSDRSNATAVALLRSLRGEVFRNYSLDWIRILRPAGLLLDTLARRVPPARWLSPLVGSLDRVVLRKTMSDERPSWVAPSRARPAEAFTDRSADQSEIAALFRELVPSFGLYPDWTDADLAMVLSHSARKAEFGDFVSRAVVAPGGTPVGFFLYHLRAGRIAHVLQIMAQKNREGVVIDRAIAHATAGGAVAIEGRVQPNLLDALAERRAIFVPRLATVVHSRDAEVLKHFREGTAFFTGLVGENWMRLNGDSF